MPGIVESSVRVGGGACGHLSMTVLLDGVQHVIRTGIHDESWDVPLDATEREQMLRLLVRWWKGKGFTLDDFAATWIGRVLVGEEGNNLKQYSFFGPGAALTKTNIGTAYVNVPLGANGERIVVDFTGCTQFRAVLSANLVATGPFQVRLVRDGDSAVLYESPSLTQTGERELDSGWTAIPGGFSGETALRVQAKSTTASDDPVFRRCVLGLK